MGIFDRFGVRDDPCVDPDFLEALLDTPEVAHAVINNRNHRFLLYSNRANRVKGYLWRIIFPLTRGAEEGLHLGKINPLKHYILLLILIEI
jgi:hypothetical protein